MTQSTQPSGKVLAGLRSTACLHFFAAVASP